MNSTYFLCWLLFTNSVSFIQMIYDKHLAETGKRRIAEASLIGWMTLGGAFGAFFASRLVRHKTRKQPFAAMMVRRVILWVIILMLWQFGALDPVFSYALAILARVT
jgi:uncharacterized membrane protein YsdA (DUF1294 family)